MSNFTGPGPMGKYVSAGTGTMLKLPSHQSMGTGGGAVQPNGSYVRFGKVGNQAVFWETSNGQDREATIRFGEPNKGRLYYQTGDFLAEGEYDARTLKQMFPDAGIQTKEFNFYDVLASLAGIYDNPKIPLVRRLDEVFADPTDPWSGSVRSSYYLYVEGKLIPLSGQQTHQTLTARPGAGSLNDHFGRAPVLKHLSFLQTVIAGEAAIVSELARTAITGGAGKAAGSATKALEASKIVQVLARSKRATKVAQAVAKVSKFVNKSGLARASVAFVKAFGSVLIKDYTLQQLQGLGSTIKLDPTKEGNDFTFDEQGNPIALLGNTKVDLNKALIHGSAAFAHSLLVVDGLAAPISNEVGKKFKNSEMAGKAADVVKNFVSSLGEKFFSGPIAAAASKAAKNPKDKAKYPEFLVEELATNLQNAVTADVIKAALSAAAFGPDK
jgi:hypothetical protein